MQSSLGVIGAKGRHTVAQGLPHNSGLCDQEEQSAGERKISKEKLEIPEDAVGNGLRDDDEEEGEGGKGDPRPGQHQHHGAQLPHSIE